MAEKEGFEGAPGLCGGYRHPSQSLAAQRFSSIRVFPSPSGSLLILAIKGRYIGLNLIPRRTYHKNQVQKMKSKVSVYALQLLYQIIGTIDIPGHGVNHVKPIPLKRQIHGLADRNDPVAASYTAVQHESLERMPIQAVIGQRLARFPQNWDEL